jgi:hypothetical protein
LGRVVSLADVASALQSAVCGGLVEVRLCLCVSGASADSLRSHFGKVGLRISGFDEPSPGIILSQPSTFKAPQT